MKIYQWIGISLFSLNIIIAAPEESTQIRSVTFIGNKNIKSSFAKRKELL